MTLPQHLIANGYETAYCGKIYHAKMTDNERSWSRTSRVEVVPVTSVQNYPGSYALPENQKTWLENKQAMLAKYGPGGSGGLVHGPAYEAADVEDHVYGDGFNTQLAIATLQDHLKHKPDQPLFLALGFTKPHLDFIAPKKYWDLYDRSMIKTATQTLPPVRMVQQPVCMLHSNCVPVMAFLSLDPSERSWLVRYCTDITRVSVMLMHRSG